MQDTTEESNYVSPAMAKVNDVYKELIGMADNLNERIGVVLIAQEGEFMSAYRGHMYNVQKEVKELKELASAAAATLARDRKVKETETARDWYKAEAFRLEDALREEMGKSASLAERLGALTSDTAWLQERNKGAARREAKLISELEASRELGALAAAAAAGEIGVTEEGEEEGGEEEEVGMASSTAARSALGKPLQRATYTPTTATLNLLSPARRKDLLARLGKEEGGGSGSGSGSGSGRGSGSGSGTRLAGGARGWVGREERGEGGLVSQLEQEIQRLQLQLEEARKGGGGGVVVVVLVVVMGRGSGKSPSLSTGVPLA